jgi:hypothetical protein
MTIGLGIFLCGLSIGFSIIILSILVSGTIITIKKDSGKDEFDKIKQDLDKLSESIEYIEEALSSLNIPMDEHK